MVTEFQTVGELRKLLEGLPDNRLILGQLIATNGQAWNLQLQFGTSKISVLQMKHVELTRLPDWPAPETRPEPPSCDGCGDDATDRCPHCQATTCGKCATCEHSALNRGESL